MQSMLCTERSGARKELNSANGLNEHFHIDGFAVHTDVLMYVKITTAPCTLTRRLKVCRRHKATSPSKT